MSDVIRVGIIGLQPDRSWGAIAHLPALAALPQYQVSALSTTRRQSAEAAASRYGITHAFDNHEALVNCPEVDLVAVTVKVPHHQELVNAAVAAGKHVYCEWPLGNGLAQAEQMARAARSAGVHGAVGLQAAANPVAMYARDLVAQGYVGDVLSCSVVGTGMNWGAYVDAPNVYTADRENGATMLTIPLAHTVDAVCHVVGEVREVSALIARRRTTTIRADTGEEMPLTAEDQVGFVGTLEGGAVLCMHYRGGMSHGTGLLWEINGTRGDLRITAAGGHAQLLDLSLSGATGDALAMAPLNVPEHYYLSALRDGVALGVAQNYALLAGDLSNGTQRCPDFDHGVRRHRLVAAIEASARTGQRCRP